MTKCSIYKNRIHVPTSAFVRFSRKTKKSNYALVYQLWDHAAKTFQLDLAQILNIL